HAAAQTCQALPGISELAKKLCGVNICTERGHREPKWALATGPTHTATSTPGLPRKKAADIRSTSRVRAGARNGLTFGQLWNAPDLAQTEIRFKAKSQ